MISIINTPDYTLAYWKQEDYHELIRKGLSKRAVEKGAMKHLLGELGCNSDDVAYKENGQPYFRTNTQTFLSISHSDGWFAVMLGTRPVGVDIQIPNKRIKAGQDYFRNERESSFSEDETALHLIWCAKEAFYKLKEGRIRDLKEDVSVLSISGETLTLSFEEKHFVVKYQLVGDVFLVFVTDWEPD